MEASFPAPKANTLTRHRRNVTKEERAKIIMMAAKGYTAQEIGTEMQRTGEAIVGILHHTGVKAGHLRLLANSIPSRPMDGSFEFTRGIR